ncbi:Calx-beta domain-containing protein, partial [Actinoplanes sp. NPDC049265]|uniref:Calx-beta domain-containing protein n=1 Tax=Actinoplanes sp. NPDC049265 TaxID=3363902 RepID=UPI00371CF3F1
EFNPGETAKSIPVTIKTDGVYELSETFAVNLSSPSPGDAPIAPMSVTVRIDDVDSGAKPVLNQLAAPVTTVKEGVTATAGFTVQLDRVASENVDVTVTVTPGTATHQSNVPGKNDFEAPAVPVTILAGDSSAVVPITINNDDVYELTETATVKVVVAAGELDAVDASSPVTATLSIVDDDAAPVITALSGVSSAAEGNTSVAVQGAMTGVAQDAYPITLTAAGAANPSGSDPAEPGDFTATGLVTSLPAGLHSAVVPLGTISLLNDKADEWDETIRVSLTGAGSPAASWLTITDDPNDLPPSVGVADPAQPVAENAGPALLPVTLDFTDSGDADSTQKTVTVKYATANGTARTPGDYTASAANASVSFPAGTTAKNISVPIINDLIFERTEDFTVTITEPGPTGVTLDNDVATVTITDDDSTRKPTFSVSDATFTEGASGNANFTINLSSVTTQPVDFEVSVTDGTATHGVNLTGPGQNDFTEPATTVTVPAGSATVSIPVPVADDSAYEGEEAATLTVSPATGEDDVIGQSDSGDLTITDNDARPTLQLSPSSGSEGTDLQIRATVTGVAQRDLPFDVAFDGDSSGGVNPAEDEDYTDNEVSGVIPAGYNPVKPLTLGTVTLNQDEIDEPAEFFRITATDTADADVSVTASYRINDDPNDLPPTIAIDDTTTIDEDLETVDVHVKLNFDSDATSTEQTLSVGWKTADGTARAGYDYTSKTGVLTFEPGVTDLSANVPIVNDTVDEPTQDFSVTLSNALPKGVGIDQDTGQVEINDNDGDGSPTLTAPASRVGAGAVPVSGRAREGAQVRIYAAAASTPTKWFLAATVTANVYGIYVASVPFDMGYYLQARVGSATSASTLVRVTQVPVLTATSTTAGVVNLTVAGNPKQTGLAVTIERQNANGTWSVVVRGATAGTAKTYAYALRGQKSGTTITFRATIAANATWGTLAGTSASKAIRVR